MPPHVQLLGYAFGAGAAYEACSRVQVDRRQRAGFGVALDERRVQDAQRFSALEPLERADEPATVDPIEQLKELAALKDQGVLTEDEFAAQKARVLGS